MGKFGEINSADTRAGKFPLVPMGAERRVLRARTWERGPPSALVEFWYFHCNNFHTWPFHVFSWKQNEKSFFAIYISISLIWACVLIKLRSKVVDSLQIIYKSPKNVLICRLSFYQHTGLYKIWQMSRMDFWTCVGCRQVSIYVDVDVDFWHIFV